MMKPELINTFKSYSFKTFISDLIAGIIVGIVALPLAIAFGIASGVGPEQGIFTAVVAGFIISAFGGTRVQIGGPTGAFAVIIYGIMQKYGFGELMIATMMAGILLILLGVFKLGGLVKFIPYTIITGFTAGIAVTIAAGQIGDFFGLTPDFSNPMLILGKEYSKVPGDFLPKVICFIKSAPSINWYSFAVAAVSLAFIFIWPKFSKKIPGSLVVIILATVVTVILDKTCGLELATIKSRYGSIPNKLPAPQLPHFSMDSIVELFPTALSIAVLGAIESLMSAVVADGMVGSKHDSNMELIAQGVANIASPVFGGIPATGAIARTATNVKNGGKTPVAGIVHALTLLLIMLCLGKFVVYIPMAALAAVLINVAWNMAGFPAIKALLKGQKSDIAVLTVTFLITVFVDLTVAIEVGLGLAAFFFIKKMIDVSEVHEHRDVLTGGLSGNEHNKDAGEETLDIPTGCFVYEVDGPLFFGTVRKFEIAVERSGSECKVIVIRMRNTLYLDAGGVQALKQLKSACDRKGITIVLSGIHTQPYMLLEKMGMADELKRENIYDNIDAALVRVREIVK